MPSTSGNYWGGGNTTKDYELMMEGTDATKKLESLVGHALTGLNLEQIDRVTATYVRKVRGKIREYQRVLRPARTTGYTFTIQFGSEGEVYTPLLQKAYQNDQNCTTWLYANRLCPPNDTTAHFYAFPDVTLNPPTFPNDLITIDDTTNVVSQQSDGQSPELIRVFTVGAFRLTDNAAPFYAVAFMTEECTDCAEDSLYQNILVGGGVGGPGDAAVLIKTTNRFGSSSTLTTGIANGNVIKSIYTDGDVILVGYADDAAEATAVSGATVFSADGGSSFTASSGISKPVHAVEYFEGQYLAAGGDTTSGDRFWTSSDGVTWTASASAALPAADALTSIAVDQDAGVFYVTGEGGKLLKGNKTSGTVALTDISSNLPGGPGILYRVAVFGEDHIAVAGASNYYAESVDGGATFVQPSIPGTAVIKGVAGSTKLRYVVGTGTVIADRTPPMTSNEYRTLTVQNGITITGDYTDVRNLPGEPNYFVACTDDGEVVILRPYYPGA